MVVRYSHDMNKINNLKLNSKKKFVAQVFFLNSRE